MIVGGLPRSRLPNPIVDASKITPISADHRERRTKPSALVGLTGGNRGNRDPSELSAKLTVSRRRDFFPLLITSDDMFRSARRASGARCSLPRVLLRWLCFLLFNKENHWKADERRRMVPDMKP
jgi:hypothetical protein